MKSLKIAAALGALSLTLGACSKEAGDGATGNAQSAEAKEAAGGKTIASGLANDGRFVALIKAAGVDQTLQGPGPYTVLVPDDAAFNALPAGTYDGWTKPENRGELTGVITNLVLPGTVLAEDISKAIDNGKGKANLATMAGSVTATKDGDKIVLTDASGNKATVTQADDKFSNGVVHHIDKVLMPAKG